MGNNIIKTFIIFILLSSNVYAQVNKKMSEYTLDTTPTTDDLFLIVDITSGITKKVTLEGALREPNLPSTIARDSEVTTLLEDYLSVEEIDTISEFNTILTDGNFLSETLANDSVFMGNASNVATATAIPSCSGATSKLLYNTTTNAYSCGVDLNEGGGEGGEATNVNGILQESFVTDCAEGILNVNVTSFQNSTLVSFNGNQYIGYWDCDRHLILGKRTLPDGIWTLYPYDGSGGRPTLTMADDYHNGIALGVDSEGFIHLSYNMHADPLLYRKSATAENVSSMPTSTMVGSNETSVTYPRFFNDSTDSNKLYFTFRTGSAGAGDQYLYVYNTTTDTWSSSGKVIDGLVSSPDRSPYIYKAPKFAPNGDLHWAFSYRVLGDESETDVVHFKWDGSSYFKSDGTAQTSPVSAANDTPLDTPTVSDGVASMSGMDVDGNNHPHVVYIKDDANNNGQVWHAYHNGSDWVISQLTTGFARTWPATVDNNTKFPDISRPEIVLDRDTNVAYVIFRYISDSPGIIVMESEPNDFTQWQKYLIYQGEVGYWEAQYDRQEWVENKVLYIPISPLAGWRDDSKSLSVLRWDPSGGARIPIYGSNRDMISIDDIDIISLDGDIVLQTPNTIRIQNHASVPDGSSNPKMIVKGNGIGTNIAFQVLNASDQSVITAFDNRNIAIGTNAPTGRVDIRGDEVRIWTGVGVDTNALSSGELYVEADLEVDGTVYMASCSGAGCGGGGATGWTDGGTNVYVTTTSDNVSLGATTGTGKLDIRGDEVNIWDGTATRDYVTGAGDLYVESDLEVDGTLYVDNLLFGGSGDSYINGNLGIGTAVPSQKLDVVGTVNATAFTGDGSALTGISAGAVGWTDGGTNVYLTTTSDSVGIGTTQPVGKLGVVGDEVRIWTTAGSDNNALSSGELYVEGDLEADGTVYAPYFSGDGSLLTGISSAGGGWVDGGTNVYVSTTSDNVGIGTTQPLTTFIVSRSDTTTYTPSGAQGARIGIQNTNTTVNNMAQLNYITASSTAALTTGVATNGIFTDHTQGSIDADFTINIKTNNILTEGMRLMSDGAGGINVGIGTFAPRGALDVRGDEVRIWTGAGSDNSAISSGELYVQGDLEVDGTLYGGNNGLLINGNVGIGTTSPTGALIIRTSTDSIGWSRQSAANQACNTTCSASCVGGLDQGTLGVVLPSLVDCADATADQCWCAGSN